MKCKQQLLINIVSVSTLLLLYSAHSDPHLSDYTVRSASECLVFHSIFCSFAETTAVPIALFPFEIHQTSVDYLALSPKALASTFLTQDDALFPNDSVAMGEKRILSGLKLIPTCPFLENRNRMATSPS